MIAKIEKHFFLEMMRGQSKESSHNVDKHTK